MSRWKNWLKGHDGHWYRLLAIVVFAVIVGIGVVLAARSTDDYKPNEQASTPPQSQISLNPPKITINEFAEGLPETTAIVSKPGDNRLFVVSRSGIIRVVNDNGSVSKTPYLNIAPRVQSDGEMGLLGLAFSPDFDTSGHLFVNYVDNSQNTVIARFTAKDDNQVDANSEEKVLTIPQPYPNHNGGDLVFGRDGYLYIALGDGGSRGDPENRAQNPDTLLGKILRIDVNEVPYKIPDSNPFVGQSGKKAEIWAWGLRNPWRISFDRKTGDLFMADVGQNAWEEINVEPVGSKGGLNYGWRCYEASKEYNTDGCEGRDSYVLPAIEYPQTEERCSVTGGYVYRGEEYPALAGKYFYGDYCGGQIYWAENKDGKWASMLAAKTKYMISAFGESSSGELYLADFATDKLYKIADTAN